MLSKNLKCLATNILKTFLFCFQAGDVVLSDESLPNDSLGANSLPAPSDNGKTSDNAPPVPSDISVPETSTFTSGIQSVCVRGGRPLHRPAIQIVDVESVLVEVQRMLVGVEFVLVEV